MLKKYLKRKVISLLTKNLLKTVDERDLLRPGPNGSIILKGHILRPEDVDSLKQDAEFIKNSTTFKFLLDDMRYISNQIMFEKCQSYDDMMFGKAMLYTIDILEKKVKNLAK